jgi:predicted MFS family arabinose efflux permease
MAFFAPSLVFMQSAYVLAGGGAVMVNVMSLTLVGEHLPNNRKAKAVSYLFAFGSLAYVIGTPLIGALTDVGGWRVVFLCLLLPTTAASFLLTLFSLPRQQKNQRHSSPEKTAFFSSVKQILGNRSAAACLVGTVLVSAGSTSFGIFAIAYYREHFLMPRDFGVAVTFVISILFVVAALIAGRFVNRLGGKNMTALCYLITGIFSLVFFFGPSLWVCLVLNLVHASSWAAGATAYRCLVIDQIPQSRGTLFSLSDVCTNVGVAIGAAAGGGLLIAFSYQAVGLVYGSLCLAAVAIYFFGARDPSKALTEI